jgi:CRP/FNR family transcriptional regulator, cyclic AMP receptor protein
VEFEVLAGLEGPARERLLRAARRRRFARNEVIFHAGDPADALHLLISGHVCVRVTTPLGETAVLAVLGPGTTFGELALLSGPRSRSATVVALDPVETLVLASDHFNRLRQEVVEVDRFLVDLLAGYIRRLDQRLLEALYVPVDRRVLRHLIALSRVYGDGSDGTVVPLTQEILASLAGTTRPTANHALRVAAAGGLISLDRGRVRIEDAAALARRAGGRLS